MPKQTVECLIEGGKASAGPPIGSSLGPLGVNVSTVVQDINKKTESFKGMQVPVKIVVDSETKEYKITIGTPPASSLILKEAGVEKGAANPLQDKVADLRIEQIIKVASMKEDNLLGKTMKEKVKEIIGTCNSMGILVEGVSGREAIELVNQGSFDKEITERKTELSAEELKEQEEEKKKLAEEMEQRREEFMARAKAILGEMAGKEKGEIKGKMRTEKIPDEIITEVMPAEEVAKPEEGAAPPVEEKEEGVKKPEEKPQEKEAEKT